MIILRVTFIDSKEYKCTLNANEAINLNVSINKTEVGQDQLEDYLCIKHGRTPLLIVPMRMILKYEYIPVNDMTVQEWAEFKK